MFGTDTLLVHEHDLMQFNEYCSINFTNEFPALDYNSRSTVFNTVAGIFLQAFVKLSTLEAKRDVTNAPSHDLLPPVNASQLETLRPQHALISLNYRVNGPWKVVIGYFQNFRRMNSKISRYMSLRLILHATKFFIFL